MKLKSTLLCVSMAAALCACGGQGGDKSKDSAAKGSESSAPVVLNLAHSLSETHTVHQAIKRFADEVAEKTKNHVQIKIFPNAQLGNETECLEQLKNGVLPMTKVSAPGLAAIFDAYHGFGLPYLFKDTEDYY
nr:TRAP transporter substrate-binding protein DctP [Succinivibrio sp.]